MLSLILRWIVTSVVILAVPHLVNGVQVDGFGAALALALSLGLLNLVVRPLLVLFTLPLTLFTLGFFLLLINALIFQMAGSFVSGVHIASFGSAFWAALVVSIVSGALHFLSKDRHGRRVVVIRSFDKPTPRIIDLN